MPRLYAKLMLASWLCNQQSEYISIICEAIMSTSTAHLNHVKGETISFGLRALDPEYDGTEIVTCSLKKAENGNQVPDDSEPVIISIPPTFVGAIGDIKAAWHFEISSAQSAELSPGNYILDARIEYALGDVDYAAPLSLVINERVTSS